MSGEIRVTPEQLAAAGSGVIAAGETVNESVYYLSSVSLEAPGFRTASEAETFSRRWRSSLSGFVDACSDLGQALGGAGSAYGEMDRDAADKFGGQ